jgi:hypothetical protein
MSTNRDKLALRKQSIRTLTAGELRVAIGGRVSADPPADPPPATTHIRW